MDSKPSKLNNYFYYLGLIIICVIYLVLRLSFPKTIEFGYDQPRLATRVIEFINNRHVLETQRFAERAPWGNISWGPAIFYFFAPFFIFTKDPLHVSYLISIFNLTSVLGIVFIGSKYFSKKVGLIAGLILATNPWWVIFSRMIYQPTPVISLVTISMILFFKTIKKPKSFYYSGLIFSWAFIIEIYVHTASFVFVSMILLFVALRKRLFNPFLVIGIMTSLFLIIPFTVNFAKVDYLPKEVKSEADKYKIGRDDPLSRIKVIAPGYFKTFSGGSMEYQLGYATTEFYRRYPILRTVESGIVYLTIFIFIFNFVKLIKSPALRFERATILLWAVAPLLFLVFIPLPNVPPIPRYFLISFPSIAILYGLTFFEVLKTSKIIYLILLVPVLWIYSIFDYSTFIKNYSFPQGHLSVFSDTQYIFLLNAINMARVNNQEKGRADLVISNDEKHPQEFAIDWATKYILLHVFNDDLVNTKKDSGYYLIDFSANKYDIRFTKIGRYGPYSVYEFKDL